MTQNKEKNLICPFMSRITESRDLVEVRCRPNCAFYKDDSQFPCRLLGALYAITFGKRKQND